jgi:putative transposase
MSGTYTNLLFHVVYSTKYRKPLIKGALKDPLCGYIGGIIRREKGILLEVGGISDHVHLPTKFSPRIAVSDMLRLIKTNSSKWINDGDYLDRHFEWQAGYAAFSVSESQVENVRRYLQNQAEHHTVTTFKDEYLNLLRRHNIDFDERYVFDEEVIV